MAKRFFINCVFHALISVSIEAKTPNFVFVLTDDQDVVMNSMIAMQKTHELIGSNGVTFENAYVNTPICCPSRSSILTGKYAHNTKVVNNSISGHCSSKFWKDKFEQKSIAAILKKRKNYTTFYAGKYLNQYGAKKAGGIQHVPIGYDWWAGLKGNSKYYNYTLSLNGTEKFFTDYYLTDLMKSYASDFLKWNHKKPFFMTLATPAAHQPFDAAKRHMNSFPNAKAVRNIPFNYSSEGKHWVVNMPPKFIPHNASRLDSMQQRRLRTLLAVDEMVESLIKDLKSFGVYENTYIIFSSDNGYHIGQFGQPCDKRQPYESDVKVPFMISGPNIPKNKSVSFPITLIDIAPTILDLVNLLIPNDMDGRSFKKELSGTNAKFNENILIEYWGEGGLNVEPACDRNTNELSECSTDTWCKCYDSRNNTYSCVLHLSSDNKFKFCHFPKELGFKEAYNLKKDPYELKNIAKDLSKTEIYYYMTILKQMGQCEGKQCKNLKFSF